MAVKFSTRRERPVSFAKDSSFALFRKSETLAARRGNPPFIMEKSYLKCILCTIRFRAPARAREDGGDRVNRHRGALRRCSGAPREGSDGWRTLARRRGRASGGGGTDRPRPRSACRGRRAGRRAEP